MSIQLFKDLFCYTKNAECIQSVKNACYSTVKNTPQLSDLKGPETSKLDWRYFEYNKIDRNELQVRIYLHKGTGTKMTDKLTNLTEKK